MRFRQRYKKSYSRGLASFLNYEIQLDNRGKTFCQIFIISIAIIFLIFMFYWLGETSYFGYDTRNVLEYRLALENDKTESPSRQVKLALSNYLNGDSKKAQSILEKALNDHPESVSVNAYYGLILADLAQYEKAAGYLEKSVAASFVEEPLIYIYLGICYYHIGHWDKALAPLEMGVKLEPSSALGYYYLGLVYKSQLMFEEAQIAFNQALLLSGNNYPQAVQELKELPP